MSVLSPSTDEIREIKSNAGLSDIQFAEPPDPEALETLEAEVLKQRPEFEVRFFGFYREKCDLSFLRHIPSVKNLVINCLQGEVENIDEIGLLPNLTSLKVGIHSLESLGFLEQVPPTLRVLYLEEAKKKTLDLSVLRRFSSLRRLYIERHHKALETIGQLPCLEELVLRSITVPELSFLMPLARLRLLDIKLGGTNNLDAIPNLPALNHLEIWQVRKLSNVAFLKHARNLSVLYLEDLPNITTLPSFRNLERLREVSLRHLSGLSDLAPVSEAPQLETFNLSDANHCGAESLAPFWRHPTLRNIGIGLGSFKKNREVRDFFKGSRIAVGPPSAFGEQ